MTGDEEDLRVKVKQGDVIKLGRVRFLIKKLKFRQSEEVFGLIRSNTMDGDQFEEALRTPEKGTETDQDYHRMTTCYKLRESTPLQ